MPIFPELNNEQAGRRSNLIKQVIPIIDQIAKERQLELVDLQIALKDQKSNCRDGVHYNHAGYLAMANCFRDAIINDTTNLQQNKAMDSDKKITTLRGHFLRVIANVKIGVLL